MLETLTKLPVGAATLKLTQGAGIMLNDLKKTAGIHDTVKLSITVRKMFDQQRLPEVMIA